MPDTPPPTDKRGPKRSSAPRSARRGRRAPFIRLLAYYLILIGAAIGLIYLFPAVRHAVVAPLGAGELPILGQGEALFRGEVPVAPRTAVASTTAYTAARIVTTTLAILGALSLVLPVAWVYTYTKRLRYDRSLVQSVIILPIVVAGILIVVKNSLALAFSLAGIVAAVRFRNTLKDPKDAVYIFLAIGIGLASGVQALDVAMVISLSFNLVVLVLWRYDVGAIYSPGGGRGMLAVGDPRLLTSQTAQRRRAVRQRILPEHAGGIEAGGILLVHADDPDAARHAVDVSLTGMAKEWKVVESEGGDETLAYVLRLKKKSSPVELLGELDDLWGAHVAAAEYIPFRYKKKKGDDD